MSNLDPDRIPALDEQLTKLAPVDRLRCIPAQQTLQRIVQVSRCRSGERTVPREQRGEPVVQAIEQSCILQHRNPGKACALPQGQRLVTPAEQIEAMLDLGVDGIVSDRPDRVREAMARRGMPLPARIQVAP
mgnify:CR=1 FL=1